jgi:arsenate-mycothiol transferase
MSKPIYVFVCVHNAGKSQMAAAIARRELKELVEVHSAGTHPGSELNAEAQAAVAELGYSTEGEYPKLLAAELARDASRVIILGDEAKIEELPETQAEIIRWQTPKPDSNLYNKMQQTRIVCDDIVDRILQLKKEMVDK